MGTKKFVEISDEIKSKIREKYDLMSVSSHETIGISTLYSNNDIHLIIHVNDRLGASALIYNKDKVISFSNEHNSIENIIEDYVHMINAPEIKDHPIE